MSSEILASALAIANSGGSSKGGPQTKKRRGADGDVLGGAAADEELITNMLKLLLYTRNDLNDLIRSNGVVIIVSDEKLQRELYALKETWYAELNKVKADKENNTEESKFVQHPMGNKEVLFHAYVVEQVRKSFEDGDVRTACTKLLNIEPKTMAAAISCCRPKYKEPKEGRKWVWNLMVHTLSPSDIVSSWGQLVGIEKNGIKIEVSRPIQSKLEKDLWTKLKSRTDMKSKMGGA